MVDEGEARPSARLLGFVRSYALATVVVAICAGALVWRSRAYEHFFEDDGFISLRYAWRLAHGRGLTWTDGERVEGYSNLLWVLLVAAGATVHDDLVEVARGLALAATLVGAGALAFVVRPRRIRDAVAPLVAGLAIVVTSPVAAWSMGGLEQPLLLALLAWATVLSFRVADDPTDTRAVNLVGLLLGLTALTRPDGALFLATTCLALVLPAWFERSTLRAAARIAAIGGLFFVGQLAFRRVYYAAWVPNTALVKLSLTKERLAQGWDYLADGELYLWNLVFMTLMAAGVAMTDRAARKRIAIPLSGAVVWAAYIVFMGGDYTPARRHLVATIVLLALASAEGLALVVRQPWTVVRPRSDGEPRTVRLDIAAAVAAALALLGLTHAQVKDPESQHAIDDTWTWSGREVGRFLARAFAAERPLVAVDAAGSLPYYASTLPCLDMLGLNDRYIATHHPADFGTGMIGHELGDGAYLLRRKPDLIAFHTADGEEQAAWRGGREMQQSPAFGELYQFVHFVTPEGTHTRLWARKEDGRIGVQRADRDVTVPGYLLARGGDAVAELDAEGRLGARVDASHPARLERLPLARGRWQAIIQSSGDVDATIEAPAGSDDLRFELGDSLLLTMRIAARGGAVAHVLRLTLRRID